MAELTKDEEELKRIYEELEIQYVDMVLHNENEFYSILEVFYDKAEQLGYDIDRRKALFTNLPLIKFLNTQFSFSFLFGKRE